LDFTVITPGTLLLEDVDLLSLELQAKLLSALKDSAQLGLKCARLVSTVSCELAGLVERGSFRADLAQYLNVLTIEVPPLGRRREDIPLLIGHFLSQAANEAGAVKRYEPKAIEWLASRNWPGNIDQLHSVVKKSLALSPTSLITAEFVKACAGPEAMQRCLSYDEAREEFTRGYLIQHLRITQGNVSQAARIAKRNRTDFYKLMARHQVEPEAFKRQVA
jgi:two-component system, NtrC family, response regulator GlrR